jgi:hypothetical protein
MGYDNRDNRLRRKDAVGMDQLVQDFIREMKISSGVNRQRAAEAWSIVSGASRYTLDVSLDKGILYVTLNSSMARNQLYFQRDILKQRINEFLDNDGLFVKTVGSQAVRSIVLK